jgi:glycosyltransferase involved in cell wall biosynthesis
VPKVCFTVNVDWFFESHRLPLADALLARGVEVHLLASTTDAAVRLRRRGIVVHEVPFSRSGRSLIELARLFRRLVGLYRTIRPDLIHNVTAKPVLLGSVAARVAVPSVPVVNAMSGFGFLLADSEAGRLTSRLAMYAYRIALRAPRTSRVIFQNREAIQRFVRPGIVRQGDAVLIAGMGVDPEIFYPPSDEPDRPTVMLVARMIRSKGVVEFAEASRAIAAEHPDARCVLVGPSDDGNPLTLDAADLELLVRDHPVEYWGATADVAGAMRQATVLVYPTHHEGLPKALLEGAATGRAIVASDIPGCREVLTEGVDGQFVPVKAPALLAARVNELLGDEAQRKRLGRAARATALERFTVARAVELHMEAYRGLGL